MGRRQQIRQQARHHARAARDRSRRYLGGAAVRGRRLTQRGRINGLLSIVVPAYKVEDYLDECLRSLRFQEYPNVEIIVVDDGSPDRVADITRAHRRRDPRIRLVQQPNGGLSAARNTGIGHARGEFLTFVDSDDIVQPGAFVAAINALRASGSDFAVLHYDRLQHTERKPAGRWIRDAHRELRLAQTLDTFPAIMVNAVAWGKVYRRDFWDATGLSFPEGRLYEDQPISMAAFARAKSFDVLPDIGVSWRIREDRSSISQASSSAKNLAQHRLAVSDSLAALRDAGKTKAHDERIVQILANNMPFFTRHLRVASDEFWDHLRLAVAELVDDVPRDVYIHSVSAQDKVLYALIMADRREDATEFLASYGHEIRRFPTTVEEGGIRSHLPMSDDFPVEESFLSDVQLALDVRSLRSAWIDGAFHMDGWSFIRNVDHAENPPTTRVFLTRSDLDAADADVIDLAVTQRDEHRLDLIAGHLHTDYLNAGFAAVLRAEQIPTAPGIWRFAVETTVAGVTRRRFLDTVSLAGGAATVQEQVFDNGRSVQVRPTPTAVELEVRDNETWAVGVDQQPGQVTIRFASTRAPRQVVLGADGRAFATAVPTKDGEYWSVRLDLSGVPDVPSDDQGPLTRPLTVQVTSADGTVSTMIGAPSTPSGPPNRVTDQRILSRYQGGDLVLFDWLPTAVDYRIDDEALVVLAHGPASLNDLIPVLRNGEDRIPGTVTATADGLYELRVPLSRQRWGHDDLALRIGRYVLTLIPPNRLSARGTPVRPVDDLLGRLPIDVALERYAAVVEAQNSSPTGMALVLRTPLQDDERGSRNQNRLRNEFHGPHLPQADRDAIVFRSLYGEVTNCNALGVHNELRARGSDLTLYWSVKDLSIPIPEGGVPLIEGSRAWHEALQRSRYHMINVHQLDWLPKPEGQVIIETMHGYPYKVMGHEWWEKGAFAAAQVRSFDRRARDWDYFVSPATYATPLLKAAFLDPADADPEILEIGYPRNDILVSAQADGIRKRTRDWLGIRPDQKVVLYAPTFRDYLSADDMAAQRVEFFDTVEAHRALGEDYAILVRGHAFNARAKGGRLFDDNVIDVTDHPEINDLILASDAAVLDYSSLRFDYAITGKPMVFLIPDLEKYDAARGGVIPYAPTAPGPHVTTTREAVRWLKDLPALSAEFADARARFMREYVDLDDGHASARLVDAVFVPRGDAPPRASEA